MPQELPNLRAARFEDYPRIQSLEARHGLLTLSPRDWRAIWVDHPLRRRLGHDWPIGWVLEDAAGQIVGSLANVPIAYSFRGRELIAATGRAWVVEPEYRGVALMLMDEYFNQAGAELFINTTVNSLAVDPFTAFGSARVPLGDWERAAFWVTSYRGFAEAALRVKHVPLAPALAPPAAALLCVKDMLTARHLPAGRFERGVEQLANFDGRFDAFWAELVEHNPGKLLAKRDSQTLLWHFAGPLRTKQVWILTACRNGLLRAYAVIKRQDHPQSGLKRMRLVDYQTVEPETDHLPALLQPALRRCSAEGIHVLEHVGCALPKMKSFDRYAPYRRKLPAWPFYFHAADPVVQSELQKPEVWDPSTYDGDASL